MSRLASARLRRRSRSTMTPGPPTAARADRVYVTFYTFEFQTVPEHGRWRAYAQPHGAREQSRSFRGVLSRPPWRCADRLNDLAEGNYRPAPHLGGHIVDRSSVRDDFPAQSEARCRSLNRSRSPRGRI